MHIGCVKDPDHLLAPAAEVTSRFAVDTLKDKVYPFANLRTSGLTWRMNDGSYMSADGVTFGQVISKARKALGLSQKELAARVMKEEDGGSISPQYLNDIEHDRRSPSSGHLIRQFSGILKIPEDYLFALAGRLPDDVRPDTSDPEKVVAAFMSFRRTLKE